MGAQSFNEEKLKLLGRIHDTQDILFGYDMIREAGFNNVSLDLIFGTPSESPETWADDISRAILLNPEHISFYSLQLEKDTPLHTDWLLGKFDALSELTDRNMYHFAIDALASAGFEQYEISNSSKPGFESRHNLKYWSMDDYLGMGVSAHSYIKGSRFANTENYTEYLTAGNVMEMTDWIHENSRFDEMSEYIFLGLRKTEGINLNSFDTHFDANFMNMFKDETEALIRRGLLEKNQRTLKLTQLGMDLSNLVFSEYV
jgi:oxygen-independent coproporphyrinogen-3 oxidase